MPAHEPVRRGDVAVAILDTNRISHFTKNSVKFTLVLKRHEMYHLYGVVSGKWVSCHELWRYRASVDTDTAFHRIDFSKIMTQPNTTLNLSGFYQRKLKCSPCEGRILMIRPFPAAALRVAQRNNFETVEAVQDYIALNGTPSALALRDKRVTDVANQRIKALIGSRKRHDDGLDAVASNTSASEVRRLNMIIERMNQERDSYR